MFLHILLYIFSLTKDYIISWHTEFGFYFLSLFFNTQIVHKLLCYMRDLLSFEKLIGKLVPHSAYSKPLEKNGCCCQFSLFAYPKSVGKMLYLPTENGKHKNYFNFS